MISLSIYNTLREIGIKNLKIKWPNDIYVNKNKISGILVENIIHNKKIKKTIIGIGININQKKFSNNIATSIINEINKEIDKDLILESLLKNIRKEYGKIKNINSYNFSSYKKLLFGYKKKLNFISDRQPFKGEIIDVKKNGKLVLLIDNKILNFEYGSISLV